MLCTDDAGMVLTSPRSFIRMMDVIVVACQEFGLTASEKKMEAMHLWSESSTTSNALHIEAPGKGINIRTCIPWWCYKRERGPRHRE